MGKKMTAEQAFLEIINNDEYRLSLELAEQNSLNSYKSLYKKGKLNLSRIDGFLEKHGYAVAQERLWIKEEPKKGGKK